MNIWFSVDNNKEVLKLPYVFPDVMIGSQLNVQNFETAGGKILTLIGKEGLRTMTIESFFPHKLYGWLPNITLAPECIDFFKRNREKKMRIVMIGAFGAVIVNMLCVIKSFSYLEKHNKDVSYALEIEEYLEPEVIT